MLACSLCEDCFQKKTEVDCHYRPQPPVFTPDFIPKVCGDRNMWIKNEPPEPTNNPALIKM